MTAKLTATSSHKITVTIMGLEDLDLNTVATMG